MIVGGDRYDRWLNGCSLAGFSFALPKVVFRKFCQVVIGIKEWFYGCDAGWFWDGFNGLIIILSRIFRPVFSFQSASSLDRKYAAVFILPGMYTLTILNCNTKLHAFRSCDGIIFVRKNFVTDLLSVKRWIS